MLSNYWSIKYEERSAEVKEGRGQGEMIHCQDRYHSKRKSKRTRADFTNVGTAGIFLSVYICMCVCVCVCVCGVRALDSENGNGEKTKGSQTYLD